MASVHTLEILVVNWEKYNPPAKRGAKANNWFRLSHDLLDDTQAQLLTPSELKLWLHMLISASKRNQASITLVPTQAQRRLNLKSSQIMSGIKKAESFGWIRILDEKNAPTDRQTDITDRHYRRFTAGAAQPAAAPEESALDPEPEPEEKPKTAPRGKSPAKTAAVWAAFTAAYRIRYDVDLADNAKIRTQMGRFIDQVGADDAPAIAEFYVRHNKRFYVEKAHDFGLCLADAVKLRTEWLRGEQVTETEARAVDRRQTSFSAWAPLLAEAEAREKGEQKNAS